MGKDSFRDFPRGARFKWWLERHTGFPRMPRGVYDYRGRRSIRQRLREAFRR